MKLILISCLLLFSNAYALEVTNIDNQELKNLITQGIPIIDVRTTSEWKETGIIEGSHLMMFFDERGSYNLENWLSNLSIIANKEDPLIIICLTGGRSNQLANYLVNVEGYKYIYNVKNGISHWKKENNPTVEPK